MFRSFPAHAQSVEVETFLAAAVVVFSAYPESVVERAIHPLHGLPGKLKFVPTIAELKAECEAVKAQQDREVELQKRYGPPIDPQQQRLSAPFVKPTGSATYSGLCERFGLRALPAGWDAVDVHQAAARHGADLPRVVEDMLQNRGPAEQSHQKSPFDTVADMARRAMRIRQEYEREGYEPVYIGEDIVTLEMAEKLGRLRKAAMTDEAAE